MNIPEIVNLDRYPVDRIDRGEGLAFARQCKQHYDETGLCMLPGFVTDPALDLLAEESEAYLQHAFFCDNTHNAYLTEEKHGHKDEHNDNDDGDDVTRRQQKTFVGSVPYDRLPRSSALNLLYQWDPLKDFIGHVLGKQTFHRFADPLGACSVNVFVDGGQHGWHFDESEFTVTLMLQAPHQGGDFEYVPRIRGLDNEKDIVRSVLDGGRDNVVKLPFTPGTLLIFGGRQTLHRVTTVSGEQPRLVPVLCYSETPGKQNSESVRKLFWGRENPRDELKVAS
jgi:hypothetical protein